MPTEAMATLDALVELKTEKTGAQKDPARRYVGLEHLAEGEPRVLGTLPSAASTSTNCVFENGDILFGKLRPNLRKCVRADFAGYCSTDILVLRARPGVDADYAAHVLRWGVVSAAAVATAEGTKMPRTSWDELRQFPVRLPRPEEQRESARTLGEVDSLIARTTALIDKLGLIREGLLADAFSGAAASWRAVEGEKTFRLFSGKTPQDLRQDGEGECLYFKVDDFNHSDNSESLVRSELTFNRVGPNAGMSVFPPGVVVFPKRGAAIFLNRVRVAQRLCTVDPNLMVMVPNDGLLPEFLAAQLTFIQLPRLADNSGIPQLNNKHLYPLQMRWPPEDVQRRVLAYLRGASNRIDAEIRYREKLRQLKSGLADDLLSGRKARECRSIETQTLLSGAA